MGRPLHGGSAVQLRRPINRARYWLVQAGVLAGYAIAFAAMDGAAMLSSSSSDRVLDKLGPIAGITMAVVLVVGSWISLAVSAKRYHDRGKSAGGCWSSWSG